MKKITILILCLGMILGLGACSSSLKDGTYTVEMSEESVEKNHGWKDVLVVTVKDNKATVKEYDSYSSDDGRAKSKDKDYPMTMEQNGTTPEIYFAQLIKSWEKANGDTAKIDAVTGATETTNDFKSMMTIALEAAKKGDTHTQTYNKK